MWKTLKEIKKQIKDLSPPAPVPTSPIPTSPDTSSYSPTSPVYTPPPSYNHTTTVKSDHYETTPEYGTSHKKEEYPIIYRPTKNKVYGEEWPTSDDLICKKVSSKGRDWCRNQKLECSVCSRMVTVRSSPPSPQALNWDWTSVPANLQAFSPIQTSIPLNPYSSS